MCNPLQTRLNQPGHPLGIDPLVVDYQVLVVDTCDLVVRLANTPELQITSIPSAAVIRLE